MLHIILFTDMKVCLCAGDMNINRKPEVQNFVLLENKTVKTLF